MFDQQYAVLLQYRAAVTGEYPDGIQAVFSCDQRRRGLVVQFAQCRVIGMDVGRITDNDVEASLSHRFRPVALHEIDVAEAFCQKIEGGSLTTWPSLESNAGLGDRKLSDVEIAHLTVS